MLLLAAVQQHTRSGHHLSALGDGAPTLRVVPVYKQPKVTLARARYQGAPPIVLHIVQSEIERERERLREIERYQASGRYGERVLRFRTAGLLVRRCICSPLLQVASQNLPDRSLARSRALADTIGCCFSSLARVRVFFCFFLLSASVLGKQKDTRHGFG